MMKHLNIVFISVMALTMSLELFSQESNNIQLSNVVDPMIGTGGHGHTYPGATMPFGMVQLSPDTRLDGWDGCGGYHYSDSVIYGFSHTHLQGTGVSDYGDILLMPCTQFNTGENEWKDRYKSSFRKETEKANAGYYSVYLDNHTIEVELTSTERVGVHKYSLSIADTLTLIIDLQHRDKLIHYSIYPLDDSTIVGHRLSENWAEEQHVYFAMRFNKEFTWRDQLSEVKTLSVSDNGDLQQEVTFVPVFAVDFGVVNELTTRVALSFCDIDGAVNNLNHEATHSDFERYRAECEKSWNEQLSRIDIEGSSETTQTIFYTSLYHSCTVPNVASDVDGRYRGTDLKIHQLRADEGLHYTVFSLWDTFRSLHPLLSWLEPERTRDFVRTMLRMYEDGGQLPVWELAGNYTGCMIGYHSVPVISDAKDWGIIGWDEDLALEAMIQAADSAHLGLTDYAELGYIPSECESESVSKTLEYSFDDACISHFASGLGKEDIANRFRHRALSWRNLYNPTSHFIQPKRDGAWVRDYDPTQVNFNYTEANGWQYTFFSPHDIQGQINFAGSPSLFCDLVDEQFTTSMKASGRHQVDITGLIGQYAHGNEPSHHVAYLQAYGGRQWRTLELVDSIINTLYTADPDGLCGNEDCGQMSAWYVLSSLGIYPIAPGSGSKQLVIGAPQFSKATIKPLGGEEFIIIKKGDGTYINTANGTSRSWINYSDLLSGGSLELVMSEDKETGFGHYVPSYPNNSINDTDFISVPGFTAVQSFQESKTSIEISCVNTKASVYFHTGDEDWKKYKKTITAKTSGDYYAKCVIGSLESKTVHHAIVKIDHDWKVTYVYPYSHQYAAAGENTLVDGMKGGDEFRTGDWQGFYSTPFEVIVDLTKYESILSLSLGCVQDIRPWIWLPKYVEFYASDDGIEFNLIKHITHNVAEDDYEKSVFRFTANEEFSAKYIKVIAMPQGVIPSWHLGAGFDRWTFVDELEISLKDD